MEQELKGIAGDEGSQVVSESVSAGLPKLYTEEDLKAARLGQSKADAALNEALRNLNQLKADYDESAAELEELKREIERRDDEAFLGDTEGLSRAKRERSVFKKEKELDKRQKKIEAENKAREAELSDAYKYLAIQEISSRYGVRPELLNFANSREEAEHLAVAIKAERSQSPTSGFRPDTGVSDAGASKTLTIEQVRKMSPEERMARIDEIAKLPLGMK